MSYITVEIEDCQAYGTNKRQTNTTVELTKKKCCIGDERE